MLLTDSQISKLAEQDIFFPFCGEKMRTLDNGISAISYGLSHAGYDIRLSDNQFVVVSTDRNRRGELDAKMFDPTLPYEACLNHAPEGAYFRLPPHSYGMGISVERISMPSNVMGLCFGKSTYARCGIIINVTPIEPGWTGHLTMSISNPTPWPARIYANEGIVQVVMLQTSEAVSSDYGDGKYQNAGANVQLATV